MSRRFKNKLLKAITWIAGAAFIVSSVCLDSDTWIPAAILLLSMGWLFLMALANGVTYIEVK
jgi:hypothetical protein